VGQLAHVDRGKTACQPDEEQLQAGQIVEAVVERGSFAVVALAEGHSDPDEQSRKPVDVAVEAEVGCEGGGRGCGRGVERIRHAIEGSGGQCVYVAHEALGDDQLASNAHNRKVAERIAQIVGNPPSGERGRVGDNILPSPHNMVHKNIPEDEVRKQIVKLNLGIANQKHHASTIADEEEMYL
jgi:hypothetical protein